MENLIIKQRPHSYNEYVSKIRISKSFRATTPNIDKTVYANTFYEQFGYFDQPIILNQNGYLIDGYIRYLVAKAHKLEKVPVIRIDVKVEEREPLPVTIRLSLKERLFGKLVLNV